MKLLNKRWEGLTLNHFLLFDIVSAHIVIIHLIIQIFHNSNFLKCANEEKQVVVAFASNHEFTPHGLDIIVNSALEECARFYQIMGLQNDSLWKGRTEL